MSKQIIIDVWSDVMCPFCYIGDTVLEQALKDFEHKENVQVNYHSYQLMPELGTDPQNLNELLAARYAPEQLAQQNKHIAQRGAELGLEFNFDKAITVNTMTAHRVSHFAAENGQGRKFVRLLFKAYFSDGLNVADPTVLAELAASAGLDAAAARRIAESDDYTDNVREDIARAAQIGFGGVPFFMFNSTYGVSGAQPLEVFKQTLERTWAES